MGQRFVVVEGVTRAGKTTLAKRLAAELDLVYRHSVPPEFAEARKLIDGIDAPLASFHLYSACNALAADAAARTPRIVLDRYLLSTLAYHPDVVAAFDESYCDRVIRHAFNRVDLLVHVTVSDDVRRKRAAASPRKWDADDLNARAAAAFPRYVAAAGVPTIVVDTSDSDADETYARVVRDERFIRAIGEAR